MSRLRLEAFRPDRPWVRPGTEVVAVAIAASVERTMVRARLTLLDLDRDVARAEQELEVGPGSTRLRLAVPVPATPRHGYGLRLDLEADGARVAATSAVEVLDGWWQSPRHAAVTGYRGPDEAAAATAALTAWQVNVVQHYDWMWRHYRYLPPDGATVFEDALGRTVSHDALRSSIEAGHACGIASLAYGAVYGAELEHVERHPDDRVFDDHGEPLSLGGAFFINDIRPGSAWRSRLLTEYATALQAFDFDGIHMDTYGPPHSGFAADGAPIDFAALYPGLIEETAEALARVAPGARVLFNCVDGFPLEAVAAAPAAALYLELWPPDDRFADVVRWIDRARARARGRPVVIAAYAATLKDVAAVVDRAEAFETVLLLGSIIAVAGAYHHTLAEGDRLLTEGYYPAAIPMQPEEVTELQALWRFTARYVHLLSGPGSTVVEPVGLSLRDDTGREVPWSGQPEAGAVWIRAAVLPHGRRVLHLVDLRHQPDAKWTDPKRVAPPAEGLRLGWVGVDSVVAVSPWTNAGDAIRPEVDLAGGWQLPSFRRWAALVSG